MFNLALCIPAVTFKGAHNHASTAFLLKVAFREGKIHESLHQKCLSVVCPLDGASDAYL